MTGNMVTAVLYMMLSAVAVLEISCYKFLALENHEAFYIVNSAATSKASAQYIDSLLEDNESINKFDFHYKKQFIFYSGNNTYGLIRLFRGSKGTTRTRIVQRPDIVDVAVDWVQDRVYWTDRTEVHSVDLDGSNDQLVLSTSDLRTYTGFEHIAIDPYERTLFVGVVTKQSWGTVTLFRSDLHGNHIKEMPMNDPDENVIYFELDLAKKKLYVQTLLLKDTHCYVMNYAGTDILELQDDYLHALSPFYFFSGKLLFTSKYSEKQPKGRSPTMNFYEGKFTSNGSFAIYQLDLWSPENSTIVDIRVYEQDAQLSSDAFYLKQCEDKQCSYGCTVLPDAGAFCQCPRRLGLAEDMKSCLWRYIHKIGADEEQLFRNGIKDCKYVVNGSRSADYYFSKGYMFYHIPSTAEIYRQSCLGPATVLRTNVSRVLGLVVDSAHDVIYWVDLPSGQLYESDTNGLNVRSRPLISDSTNNIVWDSDYYTNNIVVDPHKEYLFAALILKDGTYLITRFHLTNKERPSIKAGLGIVTSIAIEVKLERLYYAELIEDTNTTNIVVYTCNYDFEVLNHYQVETDLGIIVSISVFDDMMYCIGFNPTSGQYAYIEYSHGSRMITNIGRQNKMYMYKMVTAYQQTSPADWMCLRKGCSHMCLDNITCACPENYRLSEDDTTCLNVSEYKERSQRPVITFTHQTSDKPTGESSTMMPGASQPATSKENSGAQIVLIVIVVVMLVIVGVSVYMFPWRDDFEPESSETVEMH